MENTPPLRRDEAFSYACAACGRCCCNKGIRIGPYEILRLARARGLSTTAFIARHTEAGGTMLRNGADGVCPFLKGRACAVHADRPLVCRLYPLARRVGADGEETFTPLLAEAGSEGRRGCEGTVAAFLQRQGAEAFIVVSERYSALFRRMLAVLASTEPAEADLLEDRRAALDAGAAGDLGSTWLDIDATVAAYCAARSLPVPAEVAALLEQHLAAVSAWLDSLEKSALNE